MQGIGEWERASIPSPVVLPFQGSHMFMTPEALQTLVGTFMEVLLHRLDWLNHWQLAIHSISSPSHWPGGCGVGLKVPTLWTQGWVLWQPTQTLRLPRCSPKVTSLSYQKTASAFTLNEIPKELWARKRTNTKYTFLIINHNITVTNSNSNLKILLCITICKTKGYLFAIYILICRIPEVTLELL